MRAAGISKRFLTAATRRDFCGQQTCILYFAARFHSPRYDAQTPALCTAKNEPCNHHCCFAWPGVITGCSSDSGPTATGVPLVARSGAGYCCASGLICCHL